TVAVPRLVGAIRFTIATPLAFVRAVVDDRRPTVVAKVTTRPAGEKPDAIVTVARRATVLVPSAATLSALATTLTPVTCGKFCASVTVIEVDPNTPVLVAVARTVSAPGVMPAMYPTRSCALLTCPLLSVLPLAVLRHSLMVVPRAVSRHAPL